MRKGLLFVVFAIIIGSIALTFTGCGKKTPIPQDKKDYIGTWISRTQDTIVIRANGEGNAKVGSTTISGGSVEFPDKSTISIKAIGLGPTLKINQPPQEVEGKWQVVLDGTTYFKQ
ncbi:MAG: hypothetical protein EPN82_10570 [Bacteroidetes bacterium]|nr:MAG: hypothetical protein EPN82_10570 [Bacteroidota bacterium]